MLLGGECWVWGLNDPRPPPHSPPAFVASPHAMHIATSLVLISMENHNGATCCLHTKFFFFPLWKVLWFCPFLHGMLFPFASPKPLPLTKWCACVGQQPAGVRNKPGRLEEKREQRERHHSHQTLALTKHQSPNPNQKHWTLQTTPLQTQMNTTIQNFLYYISQANRPYLPSISTLLTYPTSTMNFDVRTFVGYLTHGKFDSETLETGQVYASLENSGFC